MTCLPRPVRRHELVRLLVCASTLLMLGAAPGDDDAAERPGAHFLQRAASGVDVGIAYRVFPSVPHGPETSSAYMLDGTLGIVAGPRRTRSLFSLASIRAVAPAPPQLIEPDYHEGCGSPGPVGIEPLTGSAYPAIVIMTIIVVKGCEPVPHVFIPKDDASAAYRSLETYTAARPSMTDGVSRRRFRVHRVRTIVFPKPVGVSVDDVHAYRFRIVEGSDVAGRAVSVALSDPSPAAEPRVGEQISLFGSSNSSTLLPVAVVEP